MVLEKVSGGELFYHLKRDGSFSVETSRYFLKQLLEGGKQINDSGYCHRDIKPWNIMLTDDLIQLKLIDFGFATALNIDALKEGPTYV